MFPQEEPEVVAFHLQLKVLEEAHPMVHPIRQKKAEEVNQQVGLLQEERALGVIHQFLPLRKKEQVGGPGEAQQILLREAKWVVIQVLSLHEMNHLQMRVQEAHLQIHPILRKKEGEVNQPEQQGCPQENLKLQK